MQQILEDIAEMVNKCLGPLGSDGFSWNTIRDFLIQISATIILFIFVKVFVWKRVTAILEDRRNSIDKELNDANDARKNAFELEEKMKNEYFEAQKQVKEIISKATADGEKKREAIVLAAKEEARLRIENANTEIEQEIARKNKEVRDLIVDIAFTAAQKIIGKEVDQDKYLDIVNEIIEGKSNDK